MSVILWGQYPRSEQLVQATRDFDRDRIDDKELSRIQESDRNALLALQKEFDYLSTGQLHWEDLIRPLSHLSPSFSSGALTRFFETNTFWRTIEGNGNIDPQTCSSWIDRAFPGNSPNQTIYSFPFWFLFQQFSSGPSLDAFIPLFEQLPKGLILFVEPSFGWNPLSGKEQAHRFLDELKKRIDSPIAIVTTFHEISSELEYLYSLPVDGIGIDFYHNTSEGVLPTFPKDKFLIAGVIDTNSTLPEEKESLIEFRQQAESFLPREKLYYSHSGPAELLPRGIMDAKVRNLTEALA